MTPLPPALNKPRRARATGIEPPIARVVNKNDTKAVPKGTETGSVCALNTFGYFVNAESKLKRWPMSKSSVRNSSTKDISSVHATSPAFCRSHDEWMQRCPSNRGVA